MERLIYNNMIRVWRLCRCMLTHLELAECNSAIKFLEENIFFSLWHLPYISILFLCCCLPTIRLVSKLRRTWDFSIVQIIVSWLKNPAFIIQLLDPQLHNNLAILHELLQTCLRNWSINVTMCKHNKKNMLVLKV